MQTVRPRRLRLLFALFVIASLLLAGRLAYWQTFGRAALLARATGRPVKIVYSREEDFVSMSKRHPATVHVKYGATRDGTLTA